MSERTRKVASGDGYGYTVLKNPVVPVVGTREDGVAVVPVQRIDKTTAIALRVSIDGDDAVVYLEVASARLIAWELATAAAIAEGKANQ